MWQMLLPPGGEPGVVFWDGYGIWRYFVVMIKGVLVWFGDFFADYLSRSLQRAVGAQIPPSGIKNEAKSIPQGWDAGKDGQPAFCMLSETILFCQFEAF